MENETHKMKEWKNRVKNKVKTKNLNVFANIFHEINE